MKFLGLLMITLMFSQFSLAAGAKPKEHQKAQMIKKELNLTDEQLAKVQEIRKTNKEAIKANKVKVQEAKKAFKLALNDPKTSQEDLTIKFNELEKLKSEMHRQRFNMMLSMRSVLNQDQIGKFCEMKKHFKNKRGRKGNKEDF